jgi:PAS domain S-box-containing protein
MPELRTIHDSPLALSALSEASKQAFAKLFDANPVPASISSFPDGKFLVVNEAFIRMFGFKREEAIGRSALSLGLYANPEDRRAIVDIINEKGSVRDMEVMIYSKSGSVLHIFTFVERIELDGKCGGMPIAGVRPPAERCLAHIQKLSGFADIK